MYKKVLCHTRGRVVDCSGFIDIELNYKLKF